MLTIKQFEKRYHDAVIVAVDEIAFSTGVHWVRGENGSGKSTFFKSVAGLIPYQGIIQFNDGVCMNSDPVVFRRYVNYGEAEPSYPGFLTGYDLIRFISKCKGATQEQQTHYIEVFGLHTYMHTSCETYSTGMLKKLSLAMAFLGTPRLIILDEPLITLDNVSRDVLIDLMKTRLKEAPTTFLISSHQMIENDKLPIEGLYTIVNKTIEKN